MNDRVKDNHNRGRVDDGHVRDLITARRGPRMTARRCRSRMSSKRGQAKTLEPEPIWCSPMSPVWVWIILERFKTVAINVGPGCHRKREQKRR